MKPWMRGLLATVVLMVVSTPSCGADRPSGEDRTPGQSRPGGGPQIEPEEGFTAFVGVNVVPMDAERILPDHTVIVRSGRIVAVGPGADVRIPAGATRIEGEGKYLMPGLAEMHGHMPGGEMEEVVMFLYVANGITTVRGMLGQEGHLTLRERANRGKFLAPTLYMAGPSFSGNTVRTPEEATARVRQQRAQGWDLIKIHPGLTMEAYDAMAVAARQEGLRFAGHVPEEVGLLHAIEMGQETFDHLDGYIAYLDGRNKPPDEDRLQDVVRLTREAGAWVVPTQVLWGVGIIGLGDAEELRKLPEMRYWPKTNLPGVVEGVEGWARRQAAAAEAAAADPGSARRWADNRNRLLKALSDGGVRILLGTDSPQIFSVPGFSLHREMRAMVDAGMTPYEVLVSGTRNVGDYFHSKDTFGTVAVGRRADLILLHRNPLDDVIHVAERMGVMVRGRWIPESEIQERLEGIARQYGN